MTKFEVRIATIAVLEIEKGDVLIDIGAGTGSVSVEAALQGARVYAVEEKDQGAELIRLNALKFDVPVKIIKGRAPDGLEAVPGYNKCFIGGSGGSLKEIFEHVHSGLPPGGIMAANFITIKNLNVFTGLMDHYSYRDVELKLIQASYVDKIGILRAQNPVLIARGRKP